MNDNKDKININDKTNKIYKQNILLEDSLKTINNSCSIGSNILIELNNQSNKLEYTNDILESDDYILNKALKTIRNMTWSGMIWNMIYSEPTETSKNIGLETKNNNVNIITNTSINIDKMDMSKSYFNYDKQNLLQNKTNIQSNKTKQDEYLEKISLRLEELHGLSIKIGLEIESQNNLIEQIDTNTEIITNKMLKVDLETKKITNSYKKFNYKSMGKFNFIDVESGLALSTDESGSLRLTNKIDYSTIFQCYSTSNTIYSIQNYKTQKYLKTDFFGNIGFTGNYIGTYEQCFLNLETDVKINPNTNTNINIYNPTGILILSKNNYHGGWLKKPKSNSGSEINNYLHIINTTSNTTNTTDIIIFQPIKLD
jgi:hypothetical protein